MIAAMALGMTMVCTMPLLAFEQRRDVEAVEATQAVEVVAVEVGAAPLAVIETGAPLRLSVPEGVASGEALVVTFDALVVGEGGGAPFVSVYLDTPDAALSAEVAGYLGALAFYPVPLSGPVSRAFSVATLPALSQVGSGSTLTFVLSDAGEGGSVVLTGVGVE